MEVTRSNFESVKEIIEEELATADFICIDGEFSGLRTGKDVNAFDTPEECYLHTKETASKFLLIQLGVCFFRKKPNSSEYKHSAFNFYIFPKPTLKNSPDKTFLCQSSALDFLANNNFDFNKLFHQGISYLTTSEEVYLQEELEEKHSTENSSIFLGNSDVDEKEQLITIPAEFQPQINDICNQVRNLIKSGSKEKLQFEVQNSFVRRLLYQELKLKFESKVFVETIQVAGNKKQNALLISSTTGGNDLMEKIKERQDREWNDLDLAVGFSSVIRSISSSGKLIVGHCMILDVLHVLEQFVAPLPEQYEQFKEFAASTFPNIIDTMYMLSLAPFKERTSLLNLSGLLNLLSHEPFSLPKIGVEEGREGYDLSEDKYHNAGYDAFVTGVSFIAMCDYLNALNPSANKNCIINGEAKFLRHYLNKLFLYKTSFQESPYINLTGNDPNPRRDHVFYMKFPKTWKNKEIFQLFKPYGGVNLAYIDDVSAFVGMRFRDKTSQAFKALGGKNSVYSLVPFKTHKAISKKVINGNSAQTPEKQKTIYDRTHWKSNKMETQSPRRNRVWKKKSDEDSEQNSESILEKAKQLVEEYEDPNPKKRGIENQELPKRKRRTSSGTFVVTEESSSGANTFEENENWE